MLVATRQGQVSLYMPDREVWKLETGSGANDIISSISVFGDRIFALSGARKLIEIDKNGKVVQKYDTLLTPSAFAISPDGNMFAVYAKQLAGYNSYYINLYRSGTGEPVASEQLSAGISALTIDNNGSVWYSTENGMFYRGLLENGKLNTSRIKTSTNNQNIAMAELDDGVYAVSNNGVFTRYSDGKETGFADSLNLKVSTACYEKDTNRFVLLTDSDVRSVNCETGKIQTVMKLSGQTSGVIYGNRLVVRNSAQLFSYDVEQASSSAVLKAVYYVSLVASVCFGILLIIFVISLFDNFSRKIIKYLKSIAAELNKSKRYYLYLLPTFTLLGIFYFYPAIWGFMLSFQDYLPGVRAEFVGLQNYIDALQNAQFWSGVGNMAIFLVTDILKALIPPILIAEVLIAMKLKRVQWWCRLLMFLPGILPGLAGLFIWSYGFFGSNGAVNSILNAIGMGSFTHNWLADGSTALSTLIMFGFPWVGFYLIFFGAIMSIPSSLTESATLEGCGWFSRIIRIDLPLIMPQIKYIFITSFIGSVQNFERIYMTTGGGPGNSTQTPSLQMFYQIFTYKNYGLASAMSFIIFGFLLVATIINLKMKTQNEMA